MEQLRDAGKIRQSDEEFEVWMARQLQRRQQLRILGTKGGPYQIPVVVHVIHNGEPIGTGTNISDEQIFSQIAVLNRDFNRLNTDAVNTPSEFLPVAASMDIEFVLAKRNPEGLPTNGINRVLGTKPSWSRNPDDATFKALSYWSSTDYLNIWVIKFANGELGYAQFPVADLPGLAEVQGGTAETDGVVVDYLVFGSVDDGAFPIDPQYNRGRTTTHEIGHFLGLRHIWGDLNNCSGTDHVSDTPTQDGPTFNCPSHPQVRCGGNKMFQNFLDWTDDVCMNLFTQGQVNRMELILDDATVPRRNSLLNSPALLDPDCSVHDVEVQMLNSPGPVTCSSTSPASITIRNRGCINVTSVRVAYSVNGSPSVQTTLALTSPLGINKATSVSVGSLSLSEGINSLSITIDQVNGLADEVPDNSILSTFVLVDNTFDKIPLRETFEVPNWSTVNPGGGTTWQLLATNYGSSATVQAFQQGTAGEEAWLVTPALDFSGTHEASVFFDLSYAWNQTTYDRLRILASTDCGNTYPIVLFDKSGPNLANEISTTPWTPLSPNQWSARYYQGLNSLAGNSQVRLAFVFTNQRGNNIYLDNVEFYLSDDPNPVDIGDDLYSIYWKTQYQAVITFDLPQRMPVDLKVVDVLGRSYIDTTVPDVLNQTYAIELNNASSGIYLMRLLINGRPYVTKFYLP